MKKIIAFLLCLLLCMSLVSCQTKNDPNEEGSETSAPASENAPTSVNNNKGNGSSVSNPLFLEKELARKAYEEALKNERTILYPYYQSTTVGETYFEDLFYFSSDHECKQAVVDMDKDGIEEMVFNDYQSGEVVILHYENGDVYGYDFSNGDMQTIYTDGSFHWYSYSDFGYEQGVSKVSFINGRMVFEELYRCEDYSTYYINGKEVTYQKYLEYIENNNKKEIEYTPLNLPLLNEGKALEIASKYWGIEQGDFDEDTGYRYRLSVGRYGELYRVCLHWFVKNSYYVHLECVLIDIDTGEITIPTYCPDGGKG